MILLGGGGGGVGKAGSRGERMKSPKCSRLGTKRKGADNGSTQKKNLTCTA